MSEVATVPAPAEEAPAEDTRPARPRVLVVDDERRALDALRRHLEDDYDVFTMTHPEAGLQLLEREPGVAVVLSDQRMPGMAGTEFLARARALQPDATRVMLTGQGSLQSAMQAINDGHVFRFLLKPCAPEDLRAAIAAAARQHALVTAERELLEQTVTGVVQMLHELVSLSHPRGAAAGRDLCRLVLEVGRRLDQPDLWELELAARLASCAADTEGQAAREGAAARLLPEGAELAKVASQLISRIPRLHNVATLLEELAEGRPRQLRSQILWATYRYCLLEAEGVVSDEALAALGEGTDERVVRALRSAKLGADEPVEVPTGALRVGMVLARPLRSKTGVALAGAGTVVTELLLQCVRSWPRGFAEHYALVRGDTVRLGDPEG